MHGGTVRMKKEEEKNVGTMEKKPKFDLAITKNLTRMFHESSDSPTVM